MTSKERWLNNRTTDYECRWHILSCILLRTWSVPLHPYKTYMTYKTMIFQDFQIPTAKVKSQLKEWNVDFNRGKWARGTVGYNRWTEAESVGVAGNGDDRRFSKVVNRSRVRLSLWMLLCILCSSVCEKLLKIRWWYFPCQWAMCVLKLSLCLFVCVCVKTTVNDIFTTTEPCACLSPILCVSCQTFTSHWISNISRNGNRA